MKENEFITELAKINITLTKEQLTSLTIYKNMLQEANQKFNLTTITTDEEIYLKHFYDSLTLIKAYDLTKNLNLLDFGTGAGFPGLVLKIVFPNLNVTLVDSNNKKISFLNEVIAKLSLTNITTLSTRIESLPNNYSEYFDIVTSRAVAPLNILLELASKYLKIGGYFIPLKSNYTQELDNSKNALKILNYVLIDIIEFDLPNSPHHRSLLKFKKIAPTPDAYPRLYDKIKKKPL